jgi:hypothetical protein
VLVVVKLTVHTDAAFATNDVGATVVNDTAVVLVAAVRVGAVPVGLTSVASADVERNNVVNTSVVPLTTPTVSLATVELARRQVLAPLFASVITTTPFSPGSDAVAVHVVGNVDGEVRATIGVVDTVVKPEGNVSCIVSPAFSEPVDDVVKLHVQVDAAALTSDVGAVLVTDTAVTAVDVMVAPTVGATAVESEDVATEKFVAPYAPAEPLIMAIVRVAAVLLGSALDVGQVCPLALDSEMITTLDSDASEPEPIQFVAKFPLPEGVCSTMAGDVLAVVNPAGKVTVIVLCDVSCPDDDVVKPTVQMDAVLATSDVGAVLLNVIVDNDEAPALTSFDSVMMLSATTAATMAP